MFSPQQHDRLGVFYIKPPQKSGLGTDVYSYSHLTQYDFVYIIECQVLSHPRCVSMSSMSSMVFQLDESFCDLKGYSSGNSWNPPQNSPTFGNLVDKI